MNRDYSRAGRCKGKAPTSIRRGAESESQEGHYRDAGWYGWSSTRMLLSTRKLQACG